MRQLRENKRLVMWAVIGLTLFLVVLISFGPLFFRVDLRYRRSSFSVMKDHATASCVVANHGRRVAERTRMSVGFLSKILDIRVSPESAGGTMEISSDQRDAVIELKNIVSRDEVTVFFSVEKMQDKPFDVHLMDVSRDRRSLKEQVIP